MQNTLLANALLACATALAVFPATALAWGATGHPHDRPHLSTQQLTFHKPAPASTPGSPATRPDAALSNR